MSKYKDNVKRLQILQAFLVAACLLASSVYIYYITRPKISNFNVADECGLITGDTVSHSIRDEDACSNACNAYCKSLEKEYHGSEFQLREGPVCNLCGCLCKSQ